MKITLNKMLLASTLAAAMAVGLAQAEGNFRCMPSW